MGILKYYSSEISENSVSNTPKRKILLIEDDEFCAYTVLRLMRSDFEIVHKFTGLEGIEEAKSYASQSLFKYLGLAQCFWMFTNIESDGVEVFSLLRESNLEAEQYLNAMFSTVNERQKKEC